MEEIWKDVIGYESYYEVSSLGRVRSVGRNVKCRNGMTIYKKQTYLKHSVNKKGYHHIKLQKDGVQTLCVRVSRLVAMNFIENPENKKEVNHIDGDKSNNSVLNLEWVTRKENMKHAVDSGLFKKPIWTPESREKNSQSLKKYRKKLKEQGLVHGRRSFNGIK